MRRNKQDANHPRRRQHSLRGQPSRPTRRQGGAPPATLHHVDEVVLGSMDPGDIILLAETESLRSAVDSIFFAVLACPACGTLGLITSAQYFGAAPVTCGSNLCSCRFRIRDTSRFIYLPLN